MAHGKEGDKYALVREFEAAMDPEVLRELREQSGGMYYSGTANTDSTEIDLMALRVVLVGNVDLASKFLLHVDELSGSDSLRDALAYFHRISNFSNVPNMIKGTYKVPAGDLLHSVALDVLDDARATKSFTDRSDKASFERPLFEAWALAALAARADEHFIDRLADALTSESAPQRIRWLRASHKKFRAASD